MDGQTNTWNEWANHVLHIIKKHDGDFDAIKKELVSMGLLIQEKLDKDIFQNFRADDYNVFKTEVLTKAKINAGIVGAIVSFLISLFARILT